MPVWIAGGSPDPLSYAGKWPLSPMFCFLFLPNLALMFFDPLLELHQVSEAGFPSTAASKSMLSHVILLTVVSSDLPEVGIRLASSFWDPF